MIRALILAVAALASAAAPAQVLDFSEAELRRILSYGPWPAPWQPDPSNRLSGKPAAIAWGERLFFEPRLSSTAGVLCATCHAPFRAWQDGAARAQGLALGDRNTPTLLDVRYHRWFGWDGANDSLWAQSIRPMLDPLEMGQTVAGVAGLVRTDPAHACGFQRSTGAAPPGNDEAVVVAVGKALAAFQETLVSGRAPFDDFRDALERGDREAAGRYPLAAQRGLRLFVGRGNCSTCHFGPGFTNGEFHDTGVPFFIEPGRVDPGRHGGIRRLRDSRYNLLGAHNDDVSGTSSVRTRHLVLEHRHFGEFKVPGLRNVARTAPYMHHGRLATLADVVRNYSGISPDRLHADGETILKPLDLTQMDIEDMVAFLDSLTERVATRAASLAPLACP